MIPKPKLKITQEEWSKNKQQVFIISTQTFTYHLRIPEQYNCGNTTPYLNEIHDIRQSILQSRNTMRQTLLSLDAQSNIIMAHSKNSASLTLDPDMVNLHTKICGFANELALLDKFFGSIALSYFDYNGLSMEVQIRRCKISLPSTPSPSIPIAFPPATYPFTLYFLPPHTPPHPLPRSSVMSLVRLVIPSVRAYIAIHGNDPLPNNPPLHWDYTPGSIRFTISGTEPSLGLKYSDIGPIIGVFLSKQRQERWWRELSARVVSKQFPVVLGEARMEWIGERGYET
ncbi:MAG: hypothetical protein Q9209_007121 [Squamulea sp. 1 TL-2023]